jgi:spoIIIJ-associated protein
MEPKKEFLQKTAEEILEQLGVTAQVTVSLEEGPRYFLAIDGQELGALIGYHGEGLSSLQLILSLAFFRRFEEWVSLSVDAGGYRREREEKIRALTQRSIDKVRFLARPVILPPMPAYERRLVHLHAAGAADITSESEGEGRERHVVLRLKAAGEGTVKDTGKEDLADAENLAEVLP